MDSLHAYQNLLSLRIYVESSRKKKVARGHSRQGWDQAKPWSLVEIKVSYFESKDTVASKDTLNRSERQPIDERIYL